MGEGRALGRARGAAGELDVDRLARVEPVGDLVQPRDLAGVAGGDLVEREPAGTRLAADLDEDPKVRKTGEVRAPDVELEICGTMSSIIPT